jgi:DNA modification methylase
MQNQQVKQLRLFEIDEEQSPSASENGSSHFNDPSFVGNKTQPVHRWVPWIAGFSSDFVGDVLDRYLSGNGTVLDPFAGVGTTLVEAVLRGHHAVGFEINPYAALACRAKINTHRIDSKCLYDEMLRFQTFYSEKTHANDVPKSSPPKGFKTRSAFYSPKVLRKVLILQDFVDTIEDPDLQDLFKLAFASTMVRYSNYSYEPSLGRRASAGKPDIEDFPVGQTILDKLLEMAQDIAWLQQSLTDQHPNVQIINDSFFEYESYLSPESIDLIITSPPYLNNYHYNRNTRPHLYWLGYAKGPRDLEPLELSNFGKYWQTVREQDTVALEFSLPDTDLAERLQTLSKVKPEKGIYGGKGWANYAASYFNDCYRFAKGIKYTLKPGGTALVVIGNSILQGILVPTDVYFGKIAESIGLELVRIDVPRTTRVGNSIIQSDVRVVKAKNSDQLYEAIVELRKV